MSEFKGRHIRAEIVLRAVRWYCRYAVRYRNLEAMMLLAVFAFLPTVAQAQNTTTFVSTIEQARGGLATVGNIDGFAFAQAQQFTTGDEEDGYTLSEIVAKLEEVGGNSSPQVSIFSDSSSSRYPGPGSSLYVLNNPTPLANGSNTFTAPADATLARATNYWVVFENTATGTAADDRYNVGRTTVRNGEEDAATASGWSIADLHYYREDQTGSDWGGHLTVLLIAIKGTTSGSTTSTDATLDDLEFEDGSDNTISLSPMFVSTTTSYTASVANAVDEITIAPTVGEIHATVAYLGGSDTEIDDANTAKDGQQVSLSVGANTIKVKVTVTADDDVTSETYTVVVTRAAVAPGQVTGVTVTPGTDQLKVAWEVASNADGYKVQWKSGTENFADAATDSREAIISSDSTSSYSISGLTDGTLYTVRVIATRTGAPSDGDASFEVTGKPGVPTLSIAAARATEGDAVEFTVTLDPAAAADVTVQYATTDGTATSDSTDLDAADFTAPSSGAELTIGAGHTSGTISIATWDDTVDEDDETFTVTLSSPSLNAEFGAEKTATGTIEDDEFPRRLVLNLDAIAGDDTVNLAEKAAGFSISGDTGSEGGASVKVSVGAADLTATSSSANPATWSVSVLAGAAYITGASVAVEVTATKTGYTSPSAVQRSLTVDLTAPTAPTYTTPSSLKVGVPIAAMSPSGGSGIDRYSATGLPPGLSIDGSTGVISGTPDTANAGSARARVEVNDAAGNTAEVSVTFPPVDKADQVLSGFGYSASSAKFGSTPPRVTAPKGVQTTLSYSATPASVCGVNPSTGALTLVGAGVCEINATAEGSDDYHSAIATYRVTVREVDTTLTLTANPAVLDERAGATSVTLTGTLDRVNPDAPTSLTLSVGAEDDSATESIDYATVGEVIFTIPPGETSGTVSFTLTTIDDFVDEPDEALSITGASRIAGLEVIGTTLSITDNDERGVRIAPGSLALPEGGDATYTLVLTSQPTAEVTVTPSLGSGDADVTVSAALTFDATNWDQARTVTVSAAQDADAADDAAMIRHAISGADYGDNEVTADDVSVSVEDDETAVTLTLDPSAVDENGGAASVTVAGTLDGAAREVATTLALSVGADDDAAVRGTDYDAVNALNLTIPSGETGGSATFTFTAIDDFLDERVEAVSITGTIRDVDFAVIGTTLSITDNDDRGVRFSPGSPRVPEGGDATYSVVLTSRPSGEVTVTPSLASQDTDLTLSGALTFSETTWDQAQTVTVSAAQDVDGASNDTATIRHAVSGADYEANGVTADDVSVTVDDDETALTLTVNPTTLGEHRRGAVVTVTGTLAGATRDVATVFTVRLGTDEDEATKGADYVAVSDLILTIPSGESSATVRFRFATIEDFIDEPDEALSITALSRTADFEVIGTTLTIIDNDERGVRISPSSLTLAEGGDATYTLVLTSQPTGEVTVTPSLGSGDTDVTPGGALIFDATNWDQARTVTVSAAGDADAGNDTATIRHTVSGADYGDDRVTADDVSVTVEDIDTAVTLTANPAAVDERGGATGVAVTATLGGGVTRDVPTSLALSVGAPADTAIEGTDYAAVNDLILTIPAGQASATASFTLTTIDDSVDERVEALSITGTVGDAGLEVIGTTLSITDNDARGVGVSPGVLTLSEGAGATYTLVLESEPTQTVTVTPRLSGSRDLTFEPASLTFAPSDWDTAQTMTLSATEDDDASHDSSVVSHAARGGEYSSLVDGALAVTISDNELESQGEPPAQVTDLSATATATHVDLIWAAAEDGVLGYRIEASYDGGANWARVEDDTGSTEPAYRHEVGLDFAETRRYRVSAVGGNGVGLPSILLRASATATAGGLTASVPTPPESATARSAIDLCWIPQGVAADELGDPAAAIVPDHAWGSTDLGDLPWGSIGGGSAEVECGEGIAVRLTSVSENRRHAFRMRASHAGAWVVSNEVRAVLVDPSKPLRTLVTAGASGLSGDTGVPETLCRDYDDPATRAHENGSFLISIGFTTAAPGYHRYEFVNDFDPAGDLTLVNATAELLDRPYDTRLGYRVRITPSLWGEPVAVSLAADVVTHAASSAGNRASGEFRRETADAVDCDSSTPELARRSRVVAARFEDDGDRNGEWSTGEPIRVTLQFDEPVRSTTTEGVPSITLAIGEQGTETTAAFSEIVRGDTLVFEHLVTADESPIRDITLRADSLTLNGGRIDSFSGPAVDLAHAEAAVVGGESLPSDLAAGWSMVPYSHGGGGTGFEINLEFSEDVDLIEVIGEQNLLEHAFSVTGGAIEAIWPGRDRQGEFLANEWAMRVVPDSEEPVTVSPILDLACDQPGAICTIDDRPLSAAPSSTVHRTELGLSVADAEVGEGPGAALIFEVTLTRAVEHPVSVDYATLDGTARAGDDYVAASGTLGFEAGQTTGLVQVRIIDDSHDEGEETLTLNLSNASNALLHDAGATGIIVNGDPMPGAWLARFGRAASDHVARAVSRRLERGAGGEHLKVGNLRLDHLFGNSAASNIAGAPSASTHPDLDPRAPGAMRPAAGPWSAAGSGGMNTRPSEGPGTGTFPAMRTGGTDTRLFSNEATTPASGGGSASASDALPSPHDVLMGSSFLLTYGDDEDASSGPWTAWGETASTRFRGGEGSLSLDGEVSTAMLGLDKRYGRWLVGSTLSHSRGGGGYQRSGALGGTLHSTLTSLNPYLHYEWSETTSLWGVFGYGVGSLRLTPEGARSALETDLSNLMAAFGGRGLLSVRSGDAGRFELALRSDALLTRTESEAVRGLEGAQGATSRVRLMLEGSGSLPLASGGMLTPKLEAGLRYDAGDAETGAGLEVGGGLGYAAGSLSFEVNARALVAHEDTHYEEWGFSGSITYTPSEDRRGLSMKLGSAWGSTQSGVQSLWNRQDASGLARDTAFDAGQRYQMELGYGFVNQRMSALWVPFIAAQAADDGGQSLQLGVRLASVSSIEADLRLGRRQDLQGLPEHAVELRASMRW